MKPVRVSDPFVFNGVMLRPGDRVAFRSAKIPLPQIDAAFTHVDEDGNLCVFSTLLAPFSHVKNNGVFGPDEVGDLVVVQEADLAVRQESRNDQLHRGQRVQTTIRDGRRFIGVLLAAFDGVIAMWPESEIGNSGFVCDMFVVGGSKHFYPA